MNMAFERLESNVRSYCRKFPSTFASAKNAIIRDEKGREYIDFFCGAGALNYGHNNDKIKRKLIEYLERDGVAHTLDLHTPAKRTFLERFDAVILKPRGYVYKIQFPAPTGTNAVEAALKLARKVTGRETVVAFTNAFHGMTLGSLAATARPAKRSAAGVTLHDIVRMPFEGYLGGKVDTIEVIRSMLFKAGCGVDLPAAFIVETVQAEGGLNVASDDWLRRLAALAKQHDILLIIDDIQAGCGRTGTFFSFEPAGLRPDIVCLSKSIGGFGLPMALVLIRPDLDIWKPGEHNGTFRGNNLAFVAAAQALEYWATGAFESEIRYKASLVTEALTTMTDWLPEASAELRGRGLLQGISWKDHTIAAAVSARLFEKGVIAEVCGPNDEVLKVMPPLTIEEELLLEGLERLSAAVQWAVGSDVRPKTRLIAAAPIAAE
jgi:diaminobutyrate-2-oxoglutarate transaminase